MALIKMGAAARRAHAGSTKTLGQALRAAGVPLVTLSPGTFAVEEADLERFLRNREEARVTGAAPEVKAKRAAPSPPAGSPTARSKSHKRRS
jgi:hypothetical protein